MTISPPRINIIGIGSDGVRGLTSQARDLLERAELILGSAYALGLLPELRCEHYTIGSDLQEAVRLLEANLGKKRMVVVASGDPLFYGVARYLCDRVGKDHFEVSPHVSSMQLAFARIKESWEEAYLTNLASHPLDEVIDRIRTAETVGLFPSEQESPAVIARSLLARGIDYFRGYVCENLGAPDERVTQGELSEIAEMDFSELSVIILRRKADRPDTRRASTQFRRFGNPDDLFIQSRPKGGLITPASVRAIALAQLEVRPTSIVWDIGAGSGSVSIEAAMLADNGVVYAIEQDAADYHLIVANAETFGVKNVKAIHGTAPAIFQNLPRPDAIFVGGLGHEVSRLLEAAYQLLRTGGNMVVNVATIEALSAAHGTLRRLAGPVDVRMVQVSQGLHQFEMVRFEGTNPTFLLAVAKT